jgi:hypothetical protein
MHEALGSITSTANKEKAGKSEVNSFKTKLFFPIISFSICHGVPSPPAPRTEGRTQGLLYHLSYNSSLLAWLLVVFFVCFFGFFFDRVLHFCLGQPWTACDPPTFFS